METNADKVIRFIETVCVTPEGQHVGKPIVLAEFQKSFIRAIYDNPAGTRRALLSIARKKVISLCTHARQHPRQAGRRQNSALLGR
jgi:phage terminase large subunit-like protein